MMSLEDDLVMLFACVLTRRIIIPISLYFIRKAFLTGVDNILNKIGPNHLPKT